MMKILGYDYKIILDPDLTDMGAARFSRLTIKLDAGMPVQQLQSTLLHEIIEALNDHLALNLPHPAISALETGLFQTLNANGVDLAPLLSDAAKG